MVLFTLLNTIALAGWSLILAVLLFQSAGWALHFFDSAFSDRLLIIDILILLEAICFVEVSRIAFGQIKGNLILGVVLHMIRMTCLLLVLPEGIGAVEKDYLSIVVLYSWALTEVGRYPMYLFPSSGLARYVRLTLPIVTFPIGAIAEAVGAYYALSKLWGNEIDASFMAKIVSLGLVIGINSILGPSMAYPALLKKGLPVLIGKKGDGSSKRTKSV